MEHDRQNPKVIITNKQFGNQNVIKNKITSPRRKKRYSKTYPSEIKSVILRSLDNKKWEYRTSRGISEEHKIDVHLVENILKSSHEVRVSIGKTVLGEKLYTLKAKKTFLGDVLSTIRSINSIKY